MTITGKDLDALNHHLTFAPTIESAIFRSKALDDVPVRLARQLAREIEQALLDVLRYHANATKDPTD